MTEWKECPEYPDYEVSEHGDVRRSAPGVGTRIGKVLRPFPKDGYKKYNLRRNCKGSNAFAHVLVTLAFIGPRPFEGAVACHRDGDKSNNYYKNLRWDTQRNNLMDAWIAGSMDAPKLTDDRVRQIRQLLSSGEKRDWIADQFGVSVAAIGDVAIGRTWSHVT